MADYYFNLPPITQLTIDQQAALNETAAISLSGGPGTGKSVVSVWRHISNHRRGKKSMLLTYTTTLTRYLKMCSKNASEDASSYVASSLRWMSSPKFCEEIIIDEAQDLPANLHRQIKQYANKVSFGADDAQILYPESSCRLNDLKDIYSNNQEHQLSKNFRSTQRIMNFAKAAFEDAFIPQSTILGLSNNVGEYPVLLISGGSKFQRSNPTQDNAIFNIISTFHKDTHNIAILVPWKKEVDFFYETISDKYICSKYHEGMNGCKEIMNIHITTFKSSKGLEFDTVIVPNFDRMLEFIPHEFHLEWQDFYVAVTRARSNLYLIANKDMPGLSHVTDKQFL